MRVKMETWSLKKFLWAWKSVVTIWTSDLEEVVLAEFEGSTRRIPDFVQMSPAKSWPDSCILPHPLSSFEHTLLLDAPSQCISRLCYLHHFQSFFLTFRWGVVFFCRGKWTTKVNRLCSLKVNILKKDWTRGFPGGAVVQESACQCRGHGFDPWSRKIPHAMEQLSPCATTTEPAL